MHQAHCTCTWLSETFLDVNTKRSIFIYRLFSLNFCSLDCDDVDVGTMVPAGQEAGMDVMFLIHPTLFIRPRGTIEWDPVLIPSIDLRTMW